MISPLSEYFSSRAKTRILEVLFSHRKPLPLRQIGDLAELAVHSVECALGDFKRQGLVTSKRIGNRLVFKLNPEHSYYAFLDEMFALTTWHFLRQRALKYGPRARQVMGFNKKVGRLISHARRQNRGN